MYVGAMGRPNNVQQPHNVHQPNNVQQPTNVQHPNTTMQHPSNVKHPNTAMQHSNNVQHPNKVRRTATGRAAPPAAGRAKLPAAEAAKLQAVRRGQLHRAGHVSLDSGYLLPDEVAKIEALEALLAREPVAELLPDEVAKIEALRALLALEPAAEGTYINDDKELDQDPMEDLVEEGTGIAKELEQFEWLPGCKLSFS